MSVAEKFSTLIWGFNDMDRIEIERFPIQPCLPPNSAIDTLLRSAFIFQEPMMIFPPAVLMGTEPNKKRLRIKKKFLCVGCIFFDPKTKGRKKIRGYPWGICRGGPFNGERRFGRCTGKEVK